MRPLVPGLVACTSVGLLALLLGSLYSVPEFTYFHTNGIYLGARERGAFEPVESSPGLWRWSVPWHLTPFHQETLDVYLIRSKGGWCLSDAGGHDTWLHAHASALLVAVRATIGEEPLRYVLLTHGHIDHVGGLPLLLKHYPDLRVVIHEAEAEYISGPKDYFDPAGFSPQLRLLKLLRMLPAGEFKMGKERAEFLSGGSGSLAQLGLPELAWTHTPGHSPGHVVWLHQPSGSLLAGDVADVLASHGRPRLQILSVSSSVVPLAQRSLCRVAAELRWERAFPCHDAFKRAGGYGRAELLPLAEAHAGCSRLGLGAARAPGLGSRLARLREWVAARLPGA